MKSPVVSGALKYQELCLAARQEKRVANCTEGPAMGVSRVRDFVISKKDFKVSSLISRFQNHFSRVMCGTHNNTLTRGLFGHFFVYGSFWPILSNTRREWQNPKRRQTPQGSPLLLASTPLAGRHLLRLGDSGWGFFHPLHLLSACMGLLAASREFSFQLDLLQRLSLSLSSSPATFFSHSAFILHELKGVNW